MKLKDILLYALARMEELFDYVSDIHLEYQEYNSFDSIISPTKDYLILAGDICYPTDPKYEQFLKYCSEKWKLIFLVSGNHEYYNKKHTINEMNDYILNITKNYPNIIYLNKTEYRNQELFPNTIIAGCTLWMDADLLPQESCSKYSLKSNYCRLSIFYNDFKHIYFHKMKSGRRLNITQHEMTCLYKDHLEWIGSIINQNIGEPHTNIIIITHHPPDPEDLKVLEKDILKLQKMPIWFHGHKHELKKQSNITNGILFKTNIISP